jgi:hypothetical protein
MDLIESEPSLHIETYLTSSESGNQVTGLKQEEAAPLVSSVVKTEREVSFVS